MVSHPGEFLKEMLEDLGTSQAEFARTIGVSSMRVSHVIKGTRPVTAELALLFGKAFGQSLGGLESPGGLRSQDRRARHRHERPVAWDEASCSRVKSRRPTGRSRTRLSGFVRAYQNECVNA